MQHTCLIEAQLSQSAAMSHKFPLACGSQMAGTFTMIETMEAKTADHKSAVGGRYVKKSPIL